MERRLNTLNKQMKINKIVQMEHWFFLSHMILLNLSLPNMFVKQNILTSVLLIYQYLGEAILSLLVGIRIAKPSSIIVKV